MRDKITASKANSLWMWGTPPLGYGLQDKQLNPNLQEAEFVNLIFSKYLRLGSIQGTTDWLNQQGYRSKCWKTAAWRYEGRPFVLPRLYTAYPWKSCLYRQNCAFCFKKVYPGKHKVIIPKELYETVQGKINIKKDITATYSRKMRSNALLTGVLFDAQDKPFTITSCSKGKVQFPVAQLYELVLNIMWRIDLSGVDIQENFSQISL